MINDLLYGGLEYKTELQSIFPKAILVDASDEVHEGRIQVNIELEIEEYIKSIIINGFHWMSLTFQLYAVDKELRPKVVQWMNELKISNPEIFKNEKDN